MGESDFKLVAVPKRIVSLVPSQTELLYDLGLEGRIVGITKFCVHPPHLRKTKTVIGGTKKVNVEKIRGLQPDLIIANKEENTLEMVAELQKICPVWVTDIKTIADNSQMVSDFGKHLGCEAEAKEWNRKIDLAAADFATFIKSNNPVRVIYLIWKDPHMAAGTDTFINEMLKLNHFENACRQNRYPEIEIDETDNAVDWILLSSEPFPFSEKNAVDIQNSTKIKAIVVDGEMFSWYGSRVVNAFEYFKKLHQILEIEKLQ